MLPVRKILFPVDFSDRCHGALPVVKDVATRLGADLTLLHVVQPATKSGVVSKREHELASILEDAAGLTVERVILPGDPARTIVRYAESHGIQLIAMPKHGSGSAQQHLLGSITTTVLRDARCSVLTNIEDLRSRQRKWNRMICALELDDRSLLVPSYAAELAAGLHMELTLVHALTNADAVSEKEAYRKMIMLCEQIRVPADLIVQTGSVARVVQKVAQRDRADLVVIGRGGEGESGNALGVQTYWLAGVSPCPVLACSREAISPNSFWTEWQQPEAVVAGSMSWR